METRGSVPDLQTDKARVSEWCGLKSSEFFHTRLTTQPEMTHLTFQIEHFHHKCLAEAHRPHTLIFVNRTSMHKRIT